MRISISLVLAIAIGIFTQTATAVGDADVAAAILDRIKQLTDSGQFSGVIVVTRAGKPVAAKAYGLADLDAKTPNTLDTIFNIGSITKEFTKVAIAQLAQAGKLSLDDTVAKHLPGTTITAADRITIRQLVEHRSGLGDIFGAKYDAAPPARLRELADFVPLFAGEPLAFEPGTSERYSNAGYVTLGLIIERVTGEKYRDYVTKHVFAPAGMTQSGWWAVDEHVPNRAIGYTLHDSAKLTPNTKSLPGRPSSAGGSFSTAADLARFYDALLADKLLSPKWTNWIVNRSFDDARREPSIGVAGGAHGVNAAVELDGAWKVIAVANLDPPAAMAAARAAIEIATGRPRGAGPMIRKLSPSGPPATEPARGTTPVK